MSRSTPLLRRAVFVEISLVLGGTTVSAKAQTPPPSEPAPHTALWSGGWASLGAGVVAAGVGIGFGVASVHAEEDHKAARTGALKKRTADDAESAAATANLMFATGGVLVAAGVTMLIIDARGSAASSAPTAIATPEGVLVGFGGRF